MSDDGEPLLRSASCNTSSPPRTARVATGGTTGSLAGKLAPSSRSGCGGSSAETQLLRSQVSECKAKIVELQAWKEQRLEDEDYMGAHHAKQLIQEQEQKLQGLRRQLDALPLPSRVETVSKGPRVSLSAGGRRPSPRRASDVAVRPAVGENALLVGSPRECAQVDVGDATSQPTRFSSLAAVAPTSSPARSIAVTLTAAPVVASPSRKVDNTVLSSSEGPSCRGVSVTPSRAANIEPMSEDESESEEEETHMDVDLAPVGGATVIGNGPGQEGEITALGGVVTQERTSDEENERRNDVEMTPADANEAIAEGGKGEEDIADDDDDDDAGEGQWHSCPGDLVELSEEGDVAQGSENRRTNGLQGPFQITQDVFDRLYPYQRSGVAWMARLARDGHGGVLADEMGLGKTVQVCAFFSGARKAGATHALLLLPVTLLDQWHKEARIWCPGWPVYKYCGTHVERARALRRVFRPAGGILLTSYNLLATDDNLFGVAVDDPPTPVRRRKRKAGAAKRRRTDDDDVEDEDSCEEEVIEPEIPVLGLPEDGAEKAWDIVVCDEAHRMKSICSLFSKSVRRVRARCRLLLTGTPVQNALQDLWALMDFCQPGVLGNYSTFVKHFAEPIDRGSVRGAPRFAVALKKHLVEQLRWLIDPHLLRRTKVGEGFVSEDWTAVKSGKDDSQVEFDRILEELGETVAPKSPETQPKGSLPPKRETLIWLLPSQEQVEVYRRVLDYSDIVREAANQGKLGLHAFRAIGLLKRLCNHPLLALKVPRKPGAWMDILSEGVNRARDAASINGAAGTLSLASGAGTCSSTSNSNATGNSGATVPNVSVVVSQTETDSCIGGGVVRKRVSCKSTEQSGLAKSPVPVEEAPAAEPSSRKRFRTKVSEPSVVSDETAPVAVVETAASPNPSPRKRFRCKSTAPSFASGEVVATAVQPASAVVVEIPQEVAHRKRFRIKGSDANIAISGGVEVPAAAAIVSLVDDDDDARHGKVNDEPLPDAQGEDIDIGDDVEAMLDMLPRDASSLLKQSAKLRCLSLLLPALASRGHRTLIFVQSTRMIDLIQICVIRPFGLRCLRIDGFTDPTLRASKVAKFEQQRDRFQCLLLSTSVGGVGLNLTSADRVVIVDPSWNPAADMQAVDRAYRIGQEREVRSYRLITSGLIEDKMFRLQVFKMGLTKSALEGDQQHRYFTSKEIRSLFAWTDPAIGETRQRLLKSPIFAESEKATVEAACEDGARDEPQGADSCNGSEGGWLSQCAGVSDFGKLLGCLAGLQEDDEDADCGIQREITNSKENLAVANERSGCAEHARRAAEERCSAVARGAAEMVAGMSSAAAARARSEQRVKELRSEIPFARRAVASYQPEVQRTLSVLELAQERRFCAAQPFLQASDAAQTAMKAAAETKAAVATADERLSEILDTTSGVLSLVDADGRATIGGIVDASSKKMRLAEDWMEKVRRAFCNAVASRAEVEAIMAQMDELVKNPDAKPLPKLEKQLAKVFRFSDACRQGLTAAIASYAEAGIAFAGTFQASSESKASPLAVIEVQTAAKVSFRQLEQVCSTPRGALDTWPASMASFLAALQKLAPAAEVRAEADAKFAEAKREQELAASESARLSEVLNACEVGLREAEAAIQSAKADEIKWRMRRQELKTETLQAREALRLARLEEREAQNESAALLKATERAEKARLRVEEAKSSAVQRLKSETYLAGQVEQAYEQKRRAMGLWSAEDEAQAEAEGEGDAKKETESKEELPSQQASPSKPLVEDSATSSGAPAEVSEGTSGGDNIGAVAVDAASVASVAAQRPVPLPGGSIRRAKFAHEMVPTEPVDGLPGPETQKDLRLLGRLFELFEARPIWLLASLREHLPAATEEDVLMWLISFVAYQWVDGPWQQAYSRLGFDPRYGMPDDSKGLQVIVFRDPEFDADAVGDAADKQQRPDCHFRRPPTSATQYYQLDDIKDDFIQEVVDGSQTLPTCSKKTGWLSQITLEAVQGRLIFRSSQMRERKSTRISGKRARASER
eukprot:TRINITY_DN11011_c0_g2_i1.p1 TRINITY_DN11011_c0_g2~~TRINITY_DN11011_c0_g2_i1.p1  ORF type:complete len:2071 (+),score=443.47 TRINITY_DN11011_c0_g2_i1:164-6214(+)